MGASLGKDVHNEIYGIVVLHTKAYIDSAVSDVSATEGVSKRPNMMIEKDKNLAKSRLTLRTLIQNLTYMALWYIYRCLKVRYICGTGRFTVNDVTDIKSYEKYCYKKSIGVLARIAKNVPISAASKKKRDEYSERVAKLKELRAAKCIRTGYIQSKLVRIAIHGVSISHVWKYENKINKRLRKVLNAMLHDAKKQEIKGIRKNLYTIINDVVNNIFVKTCMFKFWSLTKKLLPMLYAQDVGSEDSGIDEDAGDPRQMARLLTYIHARQESEKDPLDDDDPVKELTPEVRPDNTPVEVRPDNESVKAIITESIKTVVESITSDVPNHHIDQTTAALKGTTTTDATSTSTTTDATSTSTTTDATSTTTPD